jgi:hypothetical protein
MDTIVCGSCGDKHLCPGTPAPTEARHQQVIDFLSQACLLSPDHTIRAGRLYDAYQQWCSDSERLAMSHRRFGTALRALGFLVSKASYMYYHGISLKADPWA